MLLKPSELIDLNTRRADEEDVRCSVGTWPLNPDHASIANLSTVDEPPLARAEFVARVATVVVALRVSRTDLPADYDPNSGS